MGERQIAQITGSSHVCPSSVNLDQAKLLHIVLYIQRLVHGRSGVYAEQNVLMDIFAKRLRQRAEQMGISNSEAARRAGLEERRYGHYIAGRREPDLTTLKKIAVVLGTTPNWLLGVVDSDEINPNRAALIDRFANAAKGMSSQELELCIIQAEAVAAKNR